MATLRFADPGHWGRIEQHLGGAGPERFAFALTRVLSDDGEGPALLVEDVELVPDDDVEHDPSGATVAAATLDRIHDRAVTEQRGLVELVSHRHGPPHFSHADESRLITTVDYVVDLLDDRPYAAVVWAAGAVHAEWFRRREGAVERGAFRSVTVLGDHLRLLDARWEDERRFRRQLPLVGRAGQATLRRLRIAVVGQGATGSHAVTQLAYLGVRDLLLLDDDVIDATGLNRVVTAEPADIGAPKTLVARRRVLALDHDATVRALPALTPHGDRPELLEVDLIVGCVGGDGPRDRLNELAVAAGVPYLDIGTGVDAEADPPAMGARLAFVLPGGPCLACTAELDPTEVARWYAPPAPRRLDGPGEPGADTAAPGVVHLDGLAVSTALAEVVAWVIGARAPALRLDIDINGGGDDGDGDEGEPGHPGTRVWPSADRRRRPGCLECSWRYPEPAAPPVERNGCGVDG
jgi:molybdopterin/thiamine biosynthesis adenylyltransferase